ncbi:hypothetical protein Adt_23179 [Abeliophyllum distichum]|uniref:Uncharacterized protein n=1 Tax=Abeliophyllum distichum TaxID=126358 RepID=A0ABD1SA53_9LAMI
MTKLLIPGNPSPSATRVFAKMMIELCNLSMLETDEPQPDTENSDENIDSSFQDSENDIDDDADDLDWYDIPLEPVNQCSLLPNSQNQGKFVPERGTTSTSNQLELQHSNYVFIPTPGIDSTASTNYQQGMNNENDVQSLQDE